MTNMDVSAVSRFGAVIALQKQLSEWLVKDALPFWDRYGVDRRFGGYFESLDLPDSCASVLASGVIRRGRVVARQIYAFRIGHERGWHSSLGSPLRLPFFAAVSG
jgi:mannose/cellobiose epimerase-like protein (N-acyl-D-glucosamine 2-epimerase family)